MKRIALLFLLVIALGGLLAAQERNNDFEVPPSAQISYTAMTIEGTVVLVDGIPAIVVDGTTWLVHLPNGLEKLAVGTVAKVEGYKAASSLVGNVIRAETITVNGVVTEITGRNGAGIMDRDRTDRPEVAVGTGGSSMGRHSGMGMMGGNRGQGRRND